MEYFIPCFYVTWYDSELELATPDKTKGTSMKGWKSTIVIFTVIPLLFVALASLLYAHASPNTNQLTLNEPHSITIVKNIDNSNSDWKKIIIKKGDTLAAIFNRLKINQKDLVQLAKQYKSLTALHPNQTLYFQIKPPHQLAALKYPLSSAKTLIIKRENNRFISQIDQKPITTALGYKSVTIHHSLNQDARNAGLTYRMQKELQSIFGGQINFSRDIHRGDRFEFLYQVEYVNGKKYRDGDIIAAEFSHRGKTYQAVRYTYPIAHTAYYTPDGRGIEARFLHAPLHYTRISSRFTYHRLDPILHKIRPHLGVDFAARFGTPVKSIGEGRVVFIGRDGGYGRTVKISYGHHYLALYGHLSRFAKIKRHQWVHKGQIIGYVGESGWATGPHLHFGFFIDGKAKDWLAMKLPTDQSIPRSYETRFHKEARQLLAQLHLHQDTELAANNMKMKHPS
ncbi:peptidoglycan DD-metalloendopeptidase family protein [Coxiella burnetii]|uniref:peptidoglycan DD-metalloendopeptidase family protein n=1 Tax=Coxiella burnetii TaxID=777 RepID=UPI000183D12F|nr:peptidoglycan DD-metalloendopeptidase family protein [Coxiella burnetii]ACJ19089.1 peptidoglycan-specific endopeptidase, M23 family [Coxiella burnetii CbuG_Q212]ATN67434.1 peptidase M23 [Coxiella burnetii]OYK85621.1 peptidase M23 [Coxiella burnetii]